MQEKLNYKSVLKKIRENNTFDIGKEDEEFVQDTIKSGLTEDQIVRGLAAKKKYLAEGGQEFIPIEQTVPGENSETNMNETTGGEVPFGGLTKQEMLRDAFNKGVKSTTELKKLSELYDMVVSGGEKSKEEIKREEFAYASQIIEMNPEASREEARATLLEETNLSDTAISSLLDRDGVKSKEDMLTDEELREEAKYLVKENAKNIFSNQEEGLNSAIKAVESDPSLSKAEKQKVLQYIEEEYPSGRSFLQRLLPGGK